MKEIKLDKLEPGDTCDVIHELFKPECKDGIIVTIPLKEVVPMKELEKGRVKLRGGKGFEYVVTFYPLKEGKTFTVTTIDEVIEIVRREGCISLVSFCDPWLALATLKNKVKFYKLTPTGLSKCKGYIKCTDYKKLMSLVGYD